ncbi:MAG TPA: hypothetical protein VJ438_04330 [Candidatus Nanoarchaeia archaeon]|nr:hypothetical protein [Candidatus Nanoarchaeia archaeon]
MEDKLKKLRKLEKSCRDGCLLGVGMTFTGAFLDYDAVALIGAGIMGLNAVVGLYSSIEQQEYRADVEDETEKGNSQYNKQTDSNN